MNSTFFTSKFDSNELTNKCKVLLENTAVVGFSLSTYSIQELKKVLSQLDYKFDVIVMYPSGKEYSVLDINSIDNTQKDNHLYILNTNHFIE